LTVARTCEWSQGCAQDALGDDRLCSYHAKVVAGLVTTTRGSGLAVLPIDPANQDLDSLKDSFETHLEPDTDSE
jgi:hypothetical protein